MRGRFSGCWDIDPRAGANQYRGDVYFDYYFVSLTFRRATTRGGDAAAPTVKPSSRPTNIRTTGTPGSQLGHFGQLGAFLAIELLRENVDANLERAFAATERLIELATKRMDISENAVLGIAGELLLLDALGTAAAQPILRSDQLFRHGMAGVALQRTSHGKARS